MPLADLKPYFHGVARRKGAPFCLAQRLAIGAGDHEGQIVGRFLDGQALRCKATAPRPDSAPGATSVFIQDFITTYLAPDIGFA